MWNKLTKHFSNIMGIVMILILAVLIIWSIFWADFVAFITYNTQLPMALDYFILVFIASMGIYQIVAIYAKLDGICLYKQHWLQFIFGILAIIGAFGRFFTSEERNIQHTVEGAQQLGLFLGAIVASWVVTNILASIIQAKVDTRVDDPSEEKHYKLGIESLKTGTFLGSIMTNLRKGRKDKV